MKLKFGPEVYLIKDFTQKKFFEAAVPPSWIFNEMRRFYRIYNIAYKKNLPSN